jgi:hypothetical protein
MGERYPQSKRETFHDSNVTVLICPHSPKHLLRPSLVGALEGRSGSTEDEERLRGTVLVLPIKVEISQRT